MNKINKENTHPKVSTSGFKQAVDMPGDQQLTEAQCQGAGYFKDKYPKLANEKGQSGGSDGQREL